MDLNLLIWIYLVGTFLIGIYAGKYVRNFSDYIRGGSKLGILLLGGTVIATQWGGVTFLGIAGYSYENLYQGVWYALGPSIRFLFWAFLLAVVIRKVQPYTVSEWFALRYDSKCGVLSSLLNIVTGLGLLGSQFVAFGVISSTFLGWDLTTGIVVGAVIVIIYTVVGGFYAVAITDVVQLFIGLVGAILVFVMAIKNYGTMADVRAELPDTYFHPFEPWGFLFMITVFMLWLSDLPLQYTIQRITSARNLRIAYWVAILGGISYLLIYYISPAIGAYAKLAVPGLENPDQAYPEFVKHVLPGSLSALVAAALMAIIMSSADSYLLAPASLITNDFYRVWRTNATEKEIVWVSRLFTVAFALLGLYAALSFQVIIKLILTFLVIGWAMLPAYFASTMWKQASKNAAFWSMLIGAAINAWLVRYPPAVFDGYPPYYTGWIGFSVAILILVVGSYLWKDRSNETIDDKEALRGLPPQ